LQIEKRVWAISEKMAPLRVSIWASSTTAITALIEAEYLIAIWRAIFVNKSSVGPRLSPIPAVSTK
jgi:hypothetical protein